MRGLLIATVTIALLSGLGFGFYSALFRGDPPPEAPVFNDTPTRQLAQGDEFEKLAHNDAVAMYEQCLSRYIREVTGGFHATLEKQERIKGKPAHPEMPPVEVIDLWVHGDVPDPVSHKTSIEVAMKWQSGAKSFLGSEIRGTLFSEKPKAEGGYDGHVVTWRPNAAFTKLSSPVDPNNALAQGQSRYCIRDAGLYRSMLRTHEAWKIRQTAGELKTEYLGKQTPKQIGRECYVIKRICPRIEMDSFEIGGTASTDPKVVANEGFTEVTIFIDTQRWLQLGTELYRTEPDGTRVLVGAYHFRNVQLNPTIPPDTFTAEGLKK